MSQKHIAAPAQAHALATRYGSLSGLMAMLLDPTRCARASGEPRGTAGGVAWLSTHVANQSARDCAQC